MPEEMSIFFAVVVLLLMYSSLNQAAPMAAVRTQGQTSTSRSKNVVLNQSSLQSNMSPVPQSRVIRDSLPPSTPIPVRAFAQLVQCPSDSVPCPPDVPQCPPKSLEQEEKPDWSADFMKILHACLKATVKFCAELVTTTGKEYTEQRAKKHQQKMMYGISGFPAPAPVAPGGKSEDVVTNCCCVGKCWVNLKSCFNFKMKNQTNLCACAVNVAVIDN